MRIFSKKRPDPRIDSKGGAKPGPVSEDVSAGDRMILVIGPSGSGKSTFINTVTNRNDVQVNHNLAQQNSGVTTVRGPPEIGLSGVVFVDTPPIDLEDEFGLRVATTIINEWLASASRRGADVAGIIYLYAITTHRMTDPPGSQYRNFITHTRRMLPTREVPTVLATTMWEKSPPPDEEKKTKRHGEISANWRKEVNHGVVMQHNGTFNSSKMVVNELSNMEGFRI